MTITRANPISATIDLAAPGKHHGHLRLPWSRDDSAWGSLMVPITVIANGEGPTALVTGGNHGDEYEGPLAILELANSLNPADVTGRIILLPAMNFPAFRAGTRTSPIDGGNMNRLFPGRPDGTVTEKIAHFVASHLLPQADIVLDFHSGGKTLDFVPFAAVHRLPDARQQAACEAAMAAFSAPYSMMMTEIDAVGMFDTVAEEAGKVFVTTELGGGGTASARSVAIARRGLRNLLIHAGILAGEPAAAQSIMLSMDDPRAFHFSPDEGVIEYCRDLGETVEQGDPLVRIWRSDRTGAQPCTIAASMSGLLAARHVPGLVKTGDCIAVIADIIGK